MRLVHADRRWSGRCIVAASGPSLTPEVADLCRGERVVAVNDAYRLLPFADVKYACDAGWWEIHRMNVLAGEKWTSHSLSPKNDKRAVADQWGLRVIEGRNGEGFSRDPAVIHYASNSGFQAVNLAILFGSDPIILVGFDMREVDKKRHFFGNHKAPLRDGHSFGPWIESFRRAAAKLGAAPQIINATPGSALTCFPMMPLAEALNARIAA
jgi:hypothetical protein